MNEEEYVESLYENLFGTLKEITEYNTSDVIFDKIVDYFDLEVEAHREQVDTFTEMLNTFRHDNPIEKVPSAFYKTTWSKFKENS